MALLGDAGVLHGGPLVREGAGEGCWRHHFGSLKTRLLAFVFQRSVWLIMDNLESIEKCRDAGKGP